MTPAGLPHSEIPGSQVVCTSPRLIAAYHVLPRFPEPRHPPYALSCLTSISSSPRAHSGSHGASPAAGPASCRAPPQPLPPGNSAAHASAGNRFSFPPTRLVRLVKEPPGAAPRPWRRTSPTALLKPADCSLLPLANRPGSILLAARSCRRPGAHRLGGEYRARTGDLLVANQALSQLS